MTWLVVAASQEDVSSLLQSRVAKIARDEDQVAEEGQEGYYPSPPSYGYQPPSYGYQPPSYGHQPPTPTTTKRTTTTTTTRAVCNCANGIAATGSQCTTNGAHKCTHCKTGYSLSAGKCIKVCSCSNGAAATGSACARHGTHKC